VLPNARGPPLVRKGGGGLCGVKNYQIGEGELSMRKRSKGVWGVKPKEVPVRRF